MAAPIHEVDNIFNRLANELRNVVHTIRDEIVTGRGSGVPDDVTIKRLAEQQERGTGKVFNAIKRIGTEAYGRVRQTYQTTQAELAAGMEKPETLSTTLRDDLGHTISAKDLHNEVINLGAAQRERNALKEHLAEPAETTLSSIHQHQDTRDDVQMIWVAAFRKTCQDCQRLAGQIKSLGEWKESGLSPGNGNTRCGERCQCHLAPAGRLARRFGLKGSEDDIQNQLQSMMKQGVQLQEKKIETLEKLRGEKYAPSTRMNMLGQIRDTKFNPNFKDKESVFLKGSAENRLKKFKNEANRDIKSGDLTFRT